jgi:hypothetical protein
LIDNLNDLHLFTELITMLAIAPPEIIKETIGYVHMRPFSGGVKSYEVAHIASKSSYKATM